MEGHRLSEAKLRGVGQKQLLDEWGEMGRRISVGQTVSSSRPQEGNPFCLLAVLCGGQVFVKAAAGVSCSLLAPGLSALCPCANGRCLAWAGGNGRLKPFSSSDDLCWHQHGGIHFFLGCF